jgi:RNAse (barnase) inhibitor barstar
MWLGIGTSSSRAGLAVVSGGVLVELGLLAPEARFVAACRGGGRASSKVGNVNVNVLDRDEKIIGSYFVASAEVVEACRANGDRRPNRETEAIELWDLVLRGALLAPAHPRAFVWWARWRERRPEQPGEWASLSTEDRTAWLEVVRLFRGERTLRLGGDEARLVGTRESAQAALFVLDGRHVTDRPGLFCALGEALRGPGGYYGAGLDGVQDCLCGGFEIVPPFTLCWLDAEIARVSLADTAGDHGGGSLFDELIRMLRDRGVNVELR